MLYDVVLQAYVKSITCWTLSRYSKWICEQATQFLQPLVQCLLECILHPNKKASIPPSLLISFCPKFLFGVACVGRSDRGAGIQVQEAACSAFATLGEEAQQLLIPFLQPILLTMSNAFAKYKASSSDSVCSRLSPISVPGAQHAHAVRCRGHSRRLNRV